MQHSAGPPGSATARPLACWNSSFLACLPSSAPNHRIGTWFHGSTDPPVPMRSPQSRTLTWGCTPESLYPHVPCQAGQLYPPHPQLRTPRSTQESKETRSLVTTETALFRSRRGLEVKGHQSQFRFRFRDPVCCQKVLGRSRTLRADFCGPGFARGLLLQSWRPPPRPGSREFPKWLR